LACRVQMVRLVDATIQQIATTLCCPLLDVSGGGNWLFAIIEASV